MVVREKAPHASQHEAKHDGVVLEVPVVNEYGCRLHQYSD